MLSREIIMSMNQEIDYDKASLVIMSCKSIDWLPLLRQIVIKASCDLSVMDESIKKLYSKNDDIISLKFKALCYSLDATGITLESFKFISIQAKTKNQEAVNIINSLMRSGVNTHQ